MAVSATTSFDPSVATIIRRAFQVCGLLHASQEPDGDDVSLARDFLNMELLELQAEGMILQTVERTTKALSSGTAEYTLDADVFDVAIGPDNVAGTMLQSGATTETRVYAISRQEYVGRTDKQSQSVPTQVYVERQSRVKLAFWPVPNATMTFKFAKVRLAYDTNPTSTTPDVQKRRVKALTWALAYDLASAKSLPLDRAREIRSERDRLKAVAKMDDVERVNGQFYLER